MTPNHLRRLFTVAAVFATRDRSLLFLNC